MPGNCYNQTLPLVLKALFTDVRMPTIRSSAITELEHCPRRFMYKYKLGLRPKAYSAALSIGKMFHLVLQALFTGANKERALKAPDHLVNRATNEVVASADPAGFTPDGKPITKVIQEIQDDYHKARAMAFAFMDTNPFDWDKWEILETPDGTPCVELELEAKIKGISIPLIAPCDLALVKKDTGGVWIVDHKTTSMNTLARARSVRISPQIALYRLVLQCHLDAWAEPGVAEHNGCHLGKKVEGSIHNIVRKPTIKYCPNTKDKDGFDSYIDRVKQWYKDEHAKNPDASPVLQTATMFTDPVLSKELYLRLQQQARASRSAPNLERFYRAGDYACLKFNNECPFADLCSSAAPMWESLIERRFDIKFREDEDD
jgi:RecB family exonuclease